MNPETRRSSEEMFALSSRHVARAELVPARPAHLPLQPLPLRLEDPLQDLANALGDVRPDLGESVHVCLDLVPLTPARIRHHARRVERETSSAASGAGLFGPAAGVVIEIMGSFCPSPATVVASGVRPG